MTGRSRDNHHDGADAKAGRGKRKSKNNNSVQKSIDALANDTIQSILKLKPCDLYDEKSEQAQVNILTRKQQKQQDEKNT